MAFAACLAALPSVRGFAADSPVRSDLRGHPHLRDRVLFYSGVDLARDSWFGWSGAVGAPASLLHEDGLRIRIQGGTGRYRYRTGAVLGGVNDGTVASGELMLGYRRSFGPSVTTVYAGLHVENQSLAAPDAGHEAQGTAAGMKIAVEVFHRVLPQLYATAFAAASTVHRGYHARVAVAYEFSGNLTFGIEGAVNGDARYEEPRAGAFLQTSFGRTNLSLAGGYLSNSDKGESLYTTLSLYSVY